MIKTVILDLGNVILPVDFRRCHDKLARVCTHPVSEIATRIRSTGLVDRFETGEASNEEFFQKVSEVLGMNVPFEEFWEIWGSIFAPEPFIPESMIEGLARHQRLLLLSNTNSIHFEMIQQQHNFLRHFHALVLSYEVRALKPQPEIYRAAIEKAGCLAEECFFTDDMPAFVAGARAAGIDAVQFESLEQLQREMRARSIVW